MTYSVEFIGGFNPFEWPDMRCPVCGKRDFTSLSHTGIYCDYCNVKFTIRNTAGDPGCVIDCYTKDAYAPAYVCPSCQLKFSSFKEIPVCPNEKCKYTGKVEREKGIWRPYKEEGFPGRFCLVLKRGDYCSSWGACLDEDCQDYSQKYRAMEKKYSRSYPTQDEWEAYQASLDKPSGNNHKYAGTI